MPVNSANHNSKQCLVDCRTNEYINKNFSRTRTSALNALHSLLVTITRELNVITTCALNQIVAITITQVIYRADLKLCSRNPQLSTMPGYYTNSGIDISIAGDIFVASDEIIKYKSIGILHTSIAILSLATKISPAMEISLRGIGAIAI